MGGSKKQTVGYKYYLGEHMVLCHGPVDYISRIQVDEKTAWEGEEDGGTITINQPSLFGGESREGGISGNVDILMGGASQGQNSYLVSVLGAIVPAYRGVVSAVLRQCYLGNNPYLKPWAFRATRINKSNAGATQWYPSKAPIYPDGIPPQIIAATDSWQLAYDIDRTPPATPLTTGYAAASPAPFARSGTPGTLLSISGGYWIRKTVNLALAGTVRIFGGGENSCAIYIDNAKVWDPNPTNSQVNGHSFDFNHYLTAGSHTFHVYFRDEDPILQDNASITIEAEYLTAAQIDMNPVHIIRECLTNQDWGMGYQETDIDAVSFEACADTLFDEGLGMSLLWDRQMVLEDFIKEVARHIDAALYVSRRTGKFTLKLIRNDYDIASLITLSPANVTKVSNPNKPTFGELSNSVSITFWDYTTGKDATVTITDTALVQMQGQVIGTTIQYPGFSNRRNATIAAQRDLRALSASFLSCTIYANSDARNLNIGDTFKFVWPRWQINDPIVMRVSGIAFGDGKGNQVRLTCSQDVFSTPTAVVVADPGTEWVDPSGPPSIVLDQFAAEIPYYELAQNLGQTAIDNTLSANPEVGYVMAAAPKPTGSINARIWTDNGSGYEDTGTLDFCPYAITSAVLPPAQTTITVTSMSELDDVTIGTFVQLGYGNDDMEICRVDGINTGTGTVTLGRGCLDTTPKLHLAGTPLFFWDLFSGYDPAEYVMGETIDVKITAVTGQGQLSLLEAVESSVLLDQRAWRPYPPGKFQIDAAYYPTDVSPYSGPLDLTWTDRDRVQQTAGAIYDHTFGNIGPEAGTTYRVRGYLNGSLVHTEEPAISGTTWDPAEGIVRIEVHSLRDGIYSLQPAAHGFYRTLSDLRYMEDSDDYRNNETNDEEIRVTED